MTSWDQISLDAAASTAIAFAPSGSWGTLETNVANGKPAVRIAATKSANVTSPNDHVLIGASVSFGIAFVHKAPTLTTNAFYSLAQWAGATASDSCKLFYTALTGLPVFYLQCGTGTVSVISIPDFDITQAHSVVINYNGGGSFSTAGNWAIYVNGVSKTVSTQSSGGGTSAINTMGDDSGGGASNGGDHLEWIFSTAPFSGADLTGVMAYFSTRYGL